MYTNRYALTRWCAVATAKIRFRPDRDAVLEELLGHLEDHRDALMAQGYNEEDATQRTLEAMGDPKQIAPALGALHRPFWGYFLRFSRIALIVLLCLSILPVLNYASSLDLDNEIGYQDFDVYDAASYGGDTGRTLHHLSQPQTSFTSDGSTFTATDAAVYTQYMEYYQQEVTWLYIRVRQDTRLPWTAHKHYMSQLSRPGYQFAARDSLGNRYPCRVDHPSSDEAQVNSTGAQTGIFSYTHEFWLRLADPKAEWAELYYERDGRSFVLRIDLTKGGGA